MNNNEKILITLAAGAVVGALLGILFAPAKGSETRQKIAATPGELAEKLKKEFGRCKEKNVRNENEPA